MRSASDNAAAVSSGNSPKTTGNDDDLLLPLYLAYEDPWETPLEYRFV